MTLVYTIGFTRTTAADFFARLRGAGVRRLLDVRLHPTSQLAGFARRDDLAFFLRELCAADYLHEPLLAPSEALFDGFKKGGGCWSDYERGYRQLLAERQVEQRLTPALLDGPTVLLCSEPTPEQCHRRLALEYLADAWGAITAVHL